MLVGRSDGAAPVSGDRHPADLERRAAEALSSGDFTAAFSYADRRCRIVPPARAHCYVLRAEAGWRLGYKHRAMDDVDQALAISPQDVNALQRLFAWADGDRRRSAATSLIAHDHSPTVIKAAIAELLLHSEAQRWAVVSVFDTVVRGWIAWAGSRTIEVRLTLQDGTLSHLVDADPFHPLSSRRINAASFSLRRPSSPIPQYAEVLCDGEPVVCRRLPPNAPRRLPAPAQDLDTSDQETVPTVIVPVYGDREATIACFRSLLLAASSDRRRKKDPAPFRILAIDDASPDPELKSYLRKLAAADEIELLENEQNLGFVGAVNRALAEATAGDVVLLNADTVVPPGFVDRLRAVANAAPDIGTATPLSNNGDIFSFPRANTVNPMRSYDEIVALDRLAAKTNAGLAVEVPSGIGFCLYIKRSCLKAVGGLSERFERGYLEDVDFCLRARANGFRNVCAASVYVGHHGSKSFGKQKRGLVIRNLGVIENRFPSYLRECRAFESADPLRGARTALERDEIPKQGLVLIATGPGPALAIARERARRLEREGKRAAILTCRNDRFEVAAGEGGMPETPWLLERANLSEAIAEFGRLRPDRLEIFDSAVLPGIADLAGRLQIPAEYWLGRSFGSDAAKMIDPEMRIIAPTEQGFRWAGRIFPRHRIEREPWKPTPLSLRPVDRLRPLALAVVPAAPSASVWQLLRVLARRLHGARPSLPIVVAGETFNDARLMSHPNVFITGAVTSDELADVLAPHNVGWLMTDFDTALFGHPLQETARTANRAVAYRDWSDGSLKPRKGDLALGIAEDADAIANSVLHWIAGS